jgi:DNA-binding GntR family transcriptional regulator
MEQTGERVSRDGHDVAHVYERLRDAILRGEIPAGATASQVTLSRDFEVGRTPLREAVRLLQREGLVVSEPNRRISISELTSTDFEELYVARLSLEVVAVRITVPALSSQDIAELEGLLAQLEHFERRKDKAGFRAPHREFHMRLVAGAGPRGVTTIGLFFDHAERYRLAFSGDTSERWEERRREHRSIIDAAAEGDGVLAAELLARHYARTCMFVLGAMDPDHDLTRLRTALATVAPGSESSLKH